MLKPLLGNTSYNCSGNIVARRGLKNWDQHELLKSLNQYLVVTARARRIILSPFVSPKRRVANVSVFPKQHRPYRQAFSYRTDHADPWSAKPARKSTNSSSQELILNMRLSSIRGHRSLFRRWRPRRSIVDALSSGWSGWLHLDIGSPSPKVALILSIIASIILGLIIGRGRMLFLRWVQSVWVVGGICCLSVTKWCCVPPILFHTLAVVPSDVSGES